MGDAGQRGRRVLVLFGGVGGMHCTACWFCCLSVYLSLFLLTTSSIILRCDFCCSRCFGVSFTPQPDLGAFLERDELQSKGRWPFGPGIGTIYGIIEIHLSYGECLDHRQVGLLKDR